MRELRLGIDSGTTNVKVSLVDATGRFVASAGGGFPVIQQRQGWHEIHPDSWWNVIVTSVAEVMSSASALPEEVRAIGLSGIGCTPCAISRDGEILGNAPTWADSRAEAEVGQYQSMANEILWGSGSPLGSWSFLPKLWWWQRNDPRLFDQIWKVVEPVDYLVYRMTGDLESALALAPLNYAFDLKTETWDLDRAARLGIPEEILAPIARPLTLAGNGLSQESADLLGLSPGTPVLNCGGDPIPISLAVGVYKPGQTFLHTGTGSTIGILNDRKLVHPAFLTQMHILPGVSYLCGLMSAAGASMLWAKDHLVPESMAAPGGLDDDVNPFELMSDLAERESRGSHGIRYLPYLYGRQSPTWDAHMRGALLGLSSETTSGAFVRAVMEGVANEVASNMPVAAELGVPVTELRAGGGPNKSPTWNQVYADVCGVPVITTVTRGDASIGCAWMAGIAEGAFDLETCATQFAEVDRIYEPDARTHAYYREIREALEDLYPALSAYYDRVSKADF